ncbi:Duffy receptor beta form like [Actinidia chinensis var. chinensis]|uniref:Duffy receptor beta form like n=1 Tax=Actinidia chinensis var. chinensis TaxID=1590841 RepID=A0A2R6QL62_ACTCC|nr:Duffy receptor beta form like [Actinidia chinensis var. chinensis]
MVDAKAEDDDEEGFGDFTFASYPNHAVHSDQMNGRKSTADNDDDDDWGDFVESPLRSQLSNAHSARNTSGASKPFDPFGFFADQPSQSTGSVSTRAESEKTQWVKPKGALPLSIFGDVEQEEEEGSGAVDPPVADATNGRNGSSGYTGLAFNDIIGNMYNQNQQIKSENGFQSDSNGSNSNGLNMNSNSNVNGLISNSSGSNLNTVMLSSKDEFQSLQIKNVRGLSSNSDLFAGKKNSLSGLSSYSDLFGGNNDSVSVLSSNSHLFAGNNNSQSPQMQAGNGLNSDLFVGDSSIQGQQVKAVNGFNSYSSGLNLNKDLFSANIDFDAFTDPSSKQNKAENSNELNLNSSVSASNFSFMDSNFDGFISHSDTLGGDEFDGDDDGWEFKDAYSESKVGNANDKVAGKEQGNSDVTGFSSVFGNGSHGSIASFLKSNELSGKPAEVAIRFEFKPPTHSQNGFSSDSCFESVQNGTENGVNSDQVIGKVDSDENFGNFFGVFTGTGVKQEDKPKVNDLSYSEVEVLPSNGEAQGKETMSENHKGALPLPLSIFGDDELETDDSLQVQDVFTYKPSSYQGNGINIQGSNISIHDLLSNLYSQAEQIPCADNTVELTGNGLDSLDEVLNPSAVNCDNDFDNASWEFKDASSQNTAVDQTSLCSLEDANEEYSTKLKLNNHLDFYCKLKDELSFVCRCHLYSLKKAQNAAALSGEDAKVEIIEKEIQEACKELLNENINSKEYSEDQPPKDICLNVFLEVLHELKFGVLEAEYHLSRRLHLAEKDLKSAIELMKHTASTLNVLRLCSLEDQYIYVSTWSKMISVCAQELKHGSFIWKQIVEKNIQSLILSEPQGKRFILALGEIYRVVLILGASVKLYKPWILSSSVDSTSIYVLSEKCYTLWSSSGIEEALQGISDPVDFEYHSTVKALREYIHEHGELALGDHVYNQQVSLCRLSLLTSEAVPEMKMVFWSGENYFLTLANMWVNLISCDPPELPHLEVGS